MDASMTLILLDCSLTPKSHQVSPSQGTSGATRLDYNDDNDWCRFSQSGHAWSYQACSTPPRHSAQCSGFGSGNYQQGVICKGSRCSPVGGSYPTSSGQFGSGGYGTSGSYQTGSIANCRHGQNCNVGSSCRHGQNCNV